MIVCVCVYIIFYMILDEEIVSISSEIQNDNQEMLQRSGVYICLRIYLYFQIFI